MALGMSVTIWDAEIIFSPEKLRLWVPWVGAGAVMVVVTRLSRRRFVLPLSIFVIGVCFYLVLGVTGLSLETARDRGLLLGPFPAEGFLDEFDPGLVLAVDWLAVAEELPIILVVAGVAILGSLLNAIAVELASGERIDLNKDLRGTGTANILSSFGGGLVGYHLLSGTLLARHLGLVGVGAGLTAAAVCLFVFLVGADLLSMLPIGLFSAVIAFLGIDLLYSWLWQERQRLPFRDFAVVAFILLVAATIGFMEALAVGLLAASALFIFSYAQIDFMRPVSSLKLRRSHVERSEPDIEYLVEVGDKVAIFELRAFLFFGTANALLQRVESAVAAAPRPLEYVVIDFSQVQGLDASASFTISKIAELCQRHGITLMLNGMEDAMRLQFEAFTGKGGTKRAVLLTALDDALQDIETRLLARREETAPGEGARHFLTELQRRHPAVDLDQVFDEISVGDGEHLIKQGQASREIYVLMSGCLRAEVSDGWGNVMTVARVLPGGIIGEVAYYADSARSATLVAEGTARVLKVKSEKLEPGTDLAADFVVDFHRLVASYLAKRLIRVTKLLHHNGFLGAVRQNGRSLRSTPICV